MTKWKREELIAFEGLTEAIDGALNTFCAVASNGLPYRLEGWCDVAQIDPSEGWASVRSMTVAGFPVWIARQVLKDRGETAIIWRLVRWPLTEPVEQA